MFVTSLQVVFLHMQWDAPVNIPIVPKDICEPKPNTKRQPSRRTAHGVGRSQPAASIYVRFTKQTTLSTFLLERTRKSPKPVSPLLLPSALPYPTMKRSFIMDCRCTLCARPTTPIAVFLNMLDFSLVIGNTHTNTPARATTHTPHKETPHSYFRVQTFQSFVFLKIHDELLGKRCHDKLRLSSF